MQRHQNGLPRAALAAGTSEDDDRSHPDFAYHATHDPLTGLPNRFLFVDRLNQSLARAQRWGRLSAVLLIDPHPDTSCEDNRLREFASTTQACVRPSDTLARLESNRFAVLCDVYGVHEAQTIAERIATQDTALEAPRNTALEAPRDAALEAPNETAPEFEPGVSIGIAMVTDPDENLDAIMARAERWIPRTEPSQTSNIVIGESQQEVIHMTSRIPLNGADALLHRPDVDGSGADAAVAEQDATITSVRRMRLPHAAAPSEGPDDAVIDLTDSTGQLPFRVDVAHDQRIVQLERLGWGPLRPTVDLVSPSGPTCIGISGHVPAIASKDAAQQLLGAAFRVKAGALPFSANVSAAIVAPFLAELAIEATASELTANAVGIEIEANTVRHLEFSSIEHLRALRQEGVAITIRRLDASSAHDSFLEAAAARVITIGVAGMSRERLAQLVAIASRANVAVIAEGVDTRDDLTIVTQAGCRYAQGALFVFGAAPGIAELSSHR